MPFDSQTAADWAGSPERMEQRPEDCLTLFHRPGGALSQPGAERDRKRCDMEQQPGNCSTPFHRPGRRPSRMDRGLRVERMPGPCSTPFHLHAPPDG
jgi:hypothetical protein